MNCINLLSKIKRFLWAKIVRRIREKPFYPLIYKSYWHSLFINTKIKDEFCYLAARPNPGAGIGHQMANWIAGLWFANLFGLRHAHIPFTPESWENFLGFYQCSSAVQDLIKNDNYKVVTLPLFDESNPDNIEQIRKIIASYAGKKIIFVLEQDQFYFNQFGVMDQIKRLFHDDKIKRNEIIKYSKDYLNIAVHVRRGDIVAGQTNKNPNLTMRWLDLNYFTNILTSLTSELNSGRPIKIFIFSQGDKSGFIEFEQFKNVEYCLNDDPLTSFLNMVYADLLITSKSSFSYKPALLSNGIKICPREFWHGYPDDEDWFLANEHGKLEKKSLDKIKTLSS